MKTDFQLRAWIFRLLTEEELSVDSVAQRIRRDDVDTFKLACANAQARQSFERMVQQMSDQWANALGPLSRTFMRQQHAELALRGDIQVALAQLEEANPANVRDLVRAVQKVTEREVWGQNTPPSDIIDAIEMLEAADVDCAEYRERMTALYPPPAADDDEA